MERTRCSALLINSSAIPAANGETGKSSAGARQSITATLAVHLRAQRLASALRDLSHQVEEAEIFETVRVFGRFAVKRDVRGARAMFQGKGAREASGMAAERQDCESL